MSTPRFPSAIATDSDLKLAANNLETRLRASAAIGDTLLTVADASEITADMLLSIDDEIVSVTSVAGNVLTVVRGFDGTAAVSHNNGRKVESRIDAWHHNALSAEVKAIETALGAGLANLPSTTAGGIVSTSYAWTPQTPGGTLTAAAAASITLAPVPAGVPTVGQSFWISAGTGTAEAVIRSGGTAVSGGATGTVIFTPAYSHSGAWTIGPGSNGIQEALNVNPCVVIPAGTHTIKAPVELPLGANIRGVGLGTKLAPNTSSTVLFQRINATATGLNGDAMHSCISGITFDGTAFPQNSAVAIKLTGQRYIRVQNCTAIELFQLVNLDRCNQAQINDSQLIDNATLWVGSTLAATSAYGYSVNVQIVNVTHMRSDYTTPDTLMIDGLPIITISRGVVVTVTNFSAQALVNRGIGISVINDCQGVVITGGGMTQPKIGMQFIRNTVDGVLFSPGFNRVIGCVIDQYSHWGLLMDTGTYLTQIQDTALTAAFPTRGTEIAALDIRTTSWGLQIQNNYFQDTITGDALVLAAGTRDIQITGNFFENYTGLGSDMVIAAGTINGLQITGNMRSTNSTLANYLVNSSTGTNRFIKDNVGIDDVVGTPPSGGGLIVIKNPVNIVAGSGAINTIATNNGFGVPNVYTGPITLIPAAGATWTLGTAGNIATTASPAVGKAVTLFWDATTAKWYPSL